MIKPMTTVVLLILLARAGAAQSIDQAKLREAIPLPKVSFDFRIGTIVGTETGIAEDPMVRLAALQKTLHGDPADAAVYLARTGKVAVAKSVLQNLLNDDPDDEDAEKIIAILDGAP